MLLDVNLIVHTQLYQSKKKIKLYKKFNSFYHYIKNQIHFFEFH
jgi:hypothetical protein